jgi:hypothetical protein
MAMNNSEQSSQELSKLLCPDPRWRAKTECYNFLELRKMLLGQREELPMQKDVTVMPCLLPIVATGATGATNMEPSRCKRDELNRFTTTRSTDRETMELLVIP